MLQNQAHFYLYESCKGGKAYFHQNIIIRIYTTSDANYC